MLGSCVAPSLREGSSHHPSSAPLVPEEKDTCRSHHHSLSSQPESSAIYMPLSQYPKITSSTLDMGPCNSFGGTYHAFPFQGFADSIFSPWRRNFPASFIQGAWPSRRRDHLSNQFLLCPLKEPQRHRNPKSRLWAWSTGTGE